MLYKECRKAFERGNKIMIAGNGGSATQAEHFAGELVCDGYPCIALTSIAIITAIANDFGYDYVFSKQLKALGKKGDIFIGLTTSGKSTNILKASNVARNKGITPYIITGHLAPQVQVNNYIVFSGGTQYIQEETLRFLHDTWQRIKE
ncbi:MAG: hypothetical protein DRJ03_19845 [Chloroflexi bacterium]|nr:MAG: hypothetical protein DRJ03_19845 [Chloroflexota bacterium]